MSVCNCTGKCTIFPYTCTGITSTPITIPVDMNYLSLTNRIKALHEHKIRQIDENRKVSRRIDDNEKGLQSHHDMLLKLEERINTLQEKITLNPKESMELRCVLKRLDTIETTLANNVSDINERINVINRQLDTLADNDLTIRRSISELEKQIIELRGLSLHPTKPYKCPVCQGEKRIQIFTNIVEPFEARTIDNLGRHFKPCEICDSKGIVWSS